MRAGILCLFVLIMIFSTTVAFDVTQDEMDMIGWINDYRLEQGVEPLKVSMKLMESADIKSAQLAEEGRLVHYIDGRGPGDLMQEVGMQFTQAGENIGRGGDAWSQWKAYLNSPRHRANILGKIYTHVGVSVYSAGGKVYTVHHFAQSREPGKDYTPTKPTRAEPPTPGTPADVTPEPSGRGEASTADNQYVVRKGDTLWQISRRYNVSMQQLRELNDLKGTIIRPGQVLRIHE